MMQIISDTPRKSRYNPHLAEQVNRQVELEEKKEKLRGNKAPEADSKSEAKAPANSRINLPNPSINPREYIQVGIKGLNGKPVVISAYELQGSNNKNYEDTHKFVLKNGLYMPTPRIFMAHFKNVLEAQKGNTALSYADGSHVPNSEVEEMFKHLTTNHKAIFGSQPGAWAWLNARFVEGTGCLGLDLETITGLNKDNTLRADTEPLEECMDKDVYVGLDFNKQGLAKSEDTGGKYKAGKNVYFYYPREGYVARFGADSDWALLDCLGDPAYRNAGLGVFACAEGAVAQNFGGLK